ncbi:MAG: hypothetical protein LBG64_00555 [Pseudomonadales bacterium]|jgi:hypothetical protein|nr:hypothetical protein [Pseudomonadales bacterium]
MKTKIIMILITIAIVAFVIFAALGSTNQDNIDLGEIVFEEGIVNIYYFWGDGCPRCAEQNEFFLSIEDELGEYFNLYKFEVWHNEENARLLGQVADLLDKTVSGVPFTIIGDQTFTGFASRMEDDMKNAIRAQVDNEFDGLRLLIESEYYESLFSN